MFRWGRRKRKGKNAKARYDARFPVVPVRVPAALKEQLASEATAKDLMMSEYVRKLLQGIQIRERTVEKVVEKVVERPVIETVDNPEKDFEIRRQKQEIDKLRKILSRHERDKARLTETNRAMEDEIKGLQDTISSMTHDRDSLLKDHHTQSENLKNLQNRIDDLSSENELLRRQLDWVIEEVKSNDARNKKVAFVTVENHDIQVRFFFTDWKKMPQV